MSRPASRAGARGVGARVEDSLEEIPDAQPEGPRNLHLVDWAEACMAQLEPVHLVDAEADQVGDIHQA